MVISKKSIRKKEDKTMAGQGAKKVIVQFPKPLLEKAEAAASQLHTDRSKLIRLALEEKLEQIERERLELELKEGYLANASLSLAIHSDFENVVSELLQS